MPAMKPAKCQIVAQAILAGVQHVRVRHFGRVQGWTTPYISLRIGQVLLNIEDRDALASLGYAIRHAERLADDAFGAARRPAA